MKYVYITAHSGCEGTPDNSMASIMKGIELGADCVEIDIRMDKERRLWLTHDDPTDYTDLVPLSEALSVISERRTAVNCDLKQEELLYLVLEAAESSSIPPERLIFSGSVDVRLLRKDPSIAHRSRIFLNLSQIYPQFVESPPNNTAEEASFFDAHIDEIGDLVETLGVECVNASYRIMVPRRIEEARARGIQLSLWTVNEESDQRELMSMGLVNLTTRNVSSALGLRREILGIGEDSR